MPLDVSCPSVELLRRSLDPDDPITDSDRRRIETHVDACDRGCKQAIAALLRGHSLPGLPTTLPGLAPPASAEPEPLPARLGRYQLVGRLGSGGMGVVCRAHDPQLRRDVAVKIPSFHGPEQARTEARQRFLREARAAAAVRHVHVCPIYDVGEDTGHPYVVMALIEGESLAERLRRQGRFEDQAAAVALVVEVADALVAVHAAHIVHRDIKAANILLDHAGQPFLTDFGLAHAEDGEHLTASGVLMGTPGYLAPEQAATELGAVGPWSDQYSLGVVLYQLLTGRLPFEGSVPALIYQLGSQTVPLPSQFRPDLDPALERLLMKALARQPQDRYASAADFAAALRAWREGATTPTARRAPEPQRRRLTLLQCGCDLFEAEALLATLDPEEQHELLEDFRKRCRDLASQFEGTVVKTTDNGLLLCFGIPVAVEAPAQRAVCAGLDLLERLAGLNERLGQQHQHLRLSGRCAVHSDLAVVTVTGNPLEALSIVGSVLSVVDQLEHMAAPDTLAISDEVHQLVKGYFECTSLGPQKFKGTAAAKLIHRVQRQRTASNRVDVAGAVGLTPLIGRDREVALLQGCWNQAVEGRGQMVLLIGEPGIGKSRLVHDLKEYVAGPSGGGPAMRVEWPCTPHSQVGIAPAAGYFEELLGLGSHQAPSQKLDQLAAYLAELHLAGAEAVALLASLLSIPLDGRYPPLGMSPLRQKERTFDLLLDWLRELARRQPVLFVVEDLHWAGATMLEFIDLLISQTQGDRILSVLTGRPEFQPSWKSRAYSQVTLSPLTRRQTGELMAAKTGLSKVPADVVEMVADRTDGVPLFVEEFAAMLQAGSLYAVGGTPQLADVFEDHVIPATLDDLLLARLERAAGRLEVVQLAAALGREFSDELLQAVAPWGEEIVQAELAKLVQAGLLFERGRPPRVRYQFKHALIRDAAYQSLLKKKRQQFHLRIAEVLEQRFPETCTAQPELLAHHFAGGNAISRAVAYWERAGMQAQGGGAPSEAAGHFTRGLELIHTLPETPQRQAQEIALQVGLGAALQATRGYGAPEVEAACARAHALCRQTGLTTHLFPVLQGLCRYYFLRARYVRARELAEEMLRLPDQDLNLGFVVAARYALGTTLYHQGQCAEALPHLEKAVAIEVTAELRSTSYRYDVLDPWVIARIILARVLSLLGYAERAAEQCRQAVTTAEGLDHPFSLCYVLSSGAWFHHTCHDRENTQVMASRALALAVEKGFPVLAGWATILRGLSLPEGGESDRALAEVRQGVVNLQALGSEVGRSYFLALLAEACARAGRLEEGLENLAKAQEFIDATGEGYWQTEVHRLKGELLLQLDPTAIQDAEACFRQALDVARRQQARSLELRAALSLAQLWSREGQTPAARDLVATVYGSFTEGFRTHDLQTARAFLEQGPVA